MLNQLHFIDEYAGIGIIYEDNHLLIIHKPRNIPVQADESGDSSLQELLQHYLKEKYQKPGNVFLGIVHRLDRPVSGLMVFAKTSKAASRLSEQFRKADVTKTYAALVRGNVPPKATLTDYLIKNEKTNTVSVVTQQHVQAKKAILAYQVLSIKDGISLLQIQLETGRPHQIRVQLAHAGFPLLGDAKYGKASGRTDAIELKSVQLGFEHPTTKKALLFEGLIRDTENWLLF